MDTEMLSGGGLSETKLWQYPKYRPIVVLWSSSEKSNNGTEAIISIQAIQGFIDWLHFVKHLTVVRTASHS